MSPRPTIADATPQAASRGGASQTTFEQLERKIVKAVGCAVGDFELIEAGDRVLVALSGGKDSYTLLHALLALRRRAPVSFELAAANLDPGYAGYRPEVVQRFAETLGVTMHMLEAPIQQLVDTRLKPGQPACPLCSRVRRGALYTLCQQQGYNKLALGHHLDDAIETLLMNLFYAGALRAMPPQLLRDEPPAVIRPLCYVLEQDIAAFSAAAAFPVIPCASAHCADADRRRQVVKRMLTELEQQHPSIKHSARRALGNLDARWLYTVAKRDAARTSDRVEG